MIVEIKCKKCNNVMATIVATKIPEWINKWLKKTTCPNCKSIDWAKGGNINEII